MFQGVLLALAIAPSLDQAAEPVDRAAIEAYRAGDLASASSLWLQVLESDSPRVEGAERGRVLYDLGNVAARQGDWLEAVGWYTASLHLRPRDADTWANLEHARLSAELDPADRGDLVHTLKRLLSAPTRGESEWIALLALLPLAVCLGGEALRGGVLWRRGAWTALAFALLCSAPWVYGMATAGGDPMLVVAKQGAPVRSEPRNDAASIGRADAGVEVERVDELPGWVRVELADGTKGWTRAETVFALKR